MECYYRRHTPETCGMGCDRLGYCYGRAIADLCDRIRAAGEVGPHAATAAYAVGMERLGGGAEARRLIAALDLSAGTRGHPR